MMLVRVFLSVFIYFIRSANEGIRIVINKVRVEVVDESGVVTCAVV